MIHLVCLNPALDRTLLVDKFEKNLPIRPSLVKDFPGGKSFNVAYALKKMDLHDFKIHTILGGKIGEYIEQLNEEKQNPLSVTYTEKNTRTCNIYVETSSGNLLLFYEKGLVAEETLVKQFLEKLDQSLEKEDVLVFSGSLLQGMPDTFIQDFIEAHPDLKVCVDTSGQALKNAYQAKPFLIKINQEEYKEIHPEIDETDTESILDQLKKEKHEQIIVTLGAKGSLAKLKDRFFYIGSPKIDAKNPIASGDFYLAVLVKGIYKQEDPLNYLKEAAAFSAANCLNYFPEVIDGDYDKLLKEIKIESL